MSTAAGVLPSPYAIVVNPRTVLVQPPHAIHVQVVYRRSPRRRFCCALLFALLTWFFLACFFRSVLHALEWRIGGWIDSFPIPGSLRVLNCVAPDQWSDEQSSSIPGFLYSSDTSLQLPLKHSLFFMSRGPAQGHLTIMSAPSRVATATVLITADYHNRRIRDEGTEVCLVTRGSGDLGIGIFTRRWYGWGFARRSLQYAATVVLPESASPGRLRHIQNFETDVPNTVQAVGELDGRIEFLDLYLRSSNAPISVKSLAAQRAVVQTSNGAIDGIFKSSQSLALKTSNSHIAVDVGITNNNTFVSDVDIRTSNGRIEAHASLLNPSGKGGKYLVTTHTSNSPLHVDFPTSPVESTLKFQASTSNAQAFVTLHPAYEGSFQARTSNAWASVRRLGVDDPTGRGRQRVIDTTHYGHGQVRGEVSWTENQGPGSVTVTSSNSPVTIEL